jgi:surface antigen
VTLSGGVVGNQFGQGSGRVAATAAGVVIGGMIGNRIGRNMDTDDRRMAVAAEYRALEYGQTGAAMPWNNPGTRHRGQIVPGSYYSEGGRFCRSARSVASQPSLLPPTNRLPCPELIFSLSPILALLHAFRLWLERCCERLCCTALELFV